MSEDERLSHVRGGSENRLLHRYSSCVSERSQSIVGNSRLDNGIMQVSPENVFASKALLASLGLRECQVPTKHWDKKGNYEANLRKGHR